MKPFRFVALTVVVLVTTVVSVLHVRGQQPHYSDYVEGRLIIKLRDWVSGAEIAGIRSALNASVEWRFSSIEAELWDVQGTTVADAIDLYQGDPRVEYIEPDYIQRADATFPMDPRFSELWGLHNTGQTGGTPDADIDAPEAWDIETGDDVLVGVIDTGVDWTHVDLADNIYTNPGEIPGNGIDDDTNGFIDDVRGWDFVNNDNNPFDDNGHGTHVSGTIAAVGDNGIGVVGVSWSAQILPVKFLSAGGSGTTSDAIRAVEYSTMMGVRLTNNSWGGGGFSSALRSAIEAAGDAGILFVAAAGNSAVNNDLFPHYPSSYDLDNIISVANTTDDDQLAGSSNFGLVSVDLGAPGSSILSTTPGNTYSSFTGTSMASPHVSGAVSLVWSAAPSMPYLDVKDIILSSTDPIPALAGRTASGGRLNAFNALSGLDSIPPDPVTDLAVVSTGSNTVTLSWTATGDDGSAGTASVVDLRYSTSPISESNYDEATTVPAVPAPQPSGTPETFMVHGLDFNTTYYFILTVLDEQQNRSSLSNVRSGTTLGIPQVVVAPTSLGDSLFTGGTASHTVTIRNVADGTLDFTLPGPLPTWLAVDPDSGRVLAAGSLDVEFVLDATGLSGGDYVAPVAIATNDPSRPVVTINTQLHVTDAPDIALPNDAIDYGDRFIGYDYQATLTVANNGTDLLQVSQVTIDNPQYSVATSGFTLAPSGSLDLVVTFRPMSVGPILGTLSIDSDDPDQPRADVSLRGVGVIPPDVAVSPGALDESLLVGQTATHSLVIDNTGGSDLNFSLEKGAAGLSINQVVVIPGEGFGGTTAPDATAAAGADQGAYSAGHVAGRDVIQASSSALNLGAASAGGDLRILLLYTGDVSQIRDLLLSFPDILVVDTFSGTPTLSQLLAYHVVMVMVNSAFGDREAVGDVLADYVDAGGGVVLTLASFISNWAVTGRFLDEGYSPFTIGSGPVGAANLGAFDTGHPIMQGVTTASGDLLGLTTLAPGASWVADWNNGLPFVATQGERVVGINVFTAFPGFWSGDVPLILHNAALWSSGQGSCWLSVDPTSGIVPANSSVIVEVAFDATNTSCVTGGEFFDTLRVVSNDPDESEVIIPVHLQVTDAPHIVLSDASLDFRVFAGATSVETLTVANEGSEQLGVTKIASDNGDFNVNIASFVLAPGQRRDVLVAFAPFVVAHVSGALTISSNDPDQPTVTVALAGEGLDPPVIGVAPSSLSEGLFVGGSSTKTMTISNAGGNNLEWSARITSPDTLTQLYTLTIPSVDSTETVDVAPAPENVRTTAITASLQDLTDVDILWDRSHFQSSTGGWFTILSDLTARGATVTENFSQITADLLEGYEVVWLIDMGSWSAAEIAALAGWVADGGGVLFEADNSWTTVNGLLSAMGAGMVQSTTPVLSGITTRIYPHETTEGVSSLNAQSGPLASLSSVVAPAGRLVDDANNRGMGAYSEVEGGRVVVLCDELFHASSIGQANNQLFGNQVIDWLAAGVRWLSADPMSGTVEPGSSQNVAVTFDAAGLVGGDYRSDIKIENNDPLSPVKTVRTHLDVTGAADIELSDAMLDYGPVFIGATPKDTLVVSNEGTDVLVVSDVSTDNGDYTVDATSFSLDPGESREVEVTFAPSTTGIRVGTLSIASDDPDEPVLEVSLLGEGIPAPLISVSPDSLSDSLYTGGTSTHVLAISNLGGNDLVWSLATSIILTSGGEDLAQRMAENAGSPPPSGTVPPGNVDASAPPPAILAGMYTGTHLRFGISDYGEIMPFQHPVGTEHLALGTWLSGYTLAYRVAGSDNIAWASYYSRLNIVPVSYTELENGSSRSVVEVVVRTSDNRLRIHRMFTFLKNDRYVRVETRLENTSGGSLDDVVYKEYADWDVDSNFDNNWDYDLSRNMAYAWQTRYCTIAAVQTPTVMDVYGWDDYTRRETVVNFPTGPVSGLDGLEILHFDLGNMPNGAQRAITAAYASANDLAQLQSVVDRAVVRWISVDPTSGTVPPGMSADVNVTFDAAGLVTGDYNAVIEIASNDPLSPLVEVPAHLHATGAPDIAVSADSLDFGPVFIGGSGTATIDIVNQGTDVLSVSNVSTDNGEYTVDISSFALNPGQSQMVTISFAPTTVGVIPATLSIASNDPDEGTVAVVLTGEGLEPPVIGVAPSSLSDSLFTGGTSMQTLTISNTGGSDLSFDISVQAAAASVGPGVSSGARGQDLGRGSPVYDALMKGPQTEWTDKRPKTNRVVTSQARPMAGSLAASLPVVIEDPIGDGGAVDVTVLRGGTRTAELQVQIEFSTTIDPFNFGGYLSLDIDQNPATGVPPSFGAPGHDIGTEFEFTFFAIEAGSVYLYDRVTGFFIGAYPVDVQAHALSFAVALEDLGNDDGAMDVSGVLGTNIGPTDWFPNSGHGTTSGTWLDLDPLSGVVPPGGSLEVTATFDAFGLLGGDYHADIRITSNDPLSPLGEVPAHLHVTGAPDIAVSADSLDFGPLFIGGTATAAIEVLNEGTDVLNVSDVSTSHTDYSADVSSFAVNPGQSLMVAISFAPTTEGLMPATLSITSDDPDEPVLEVSLLGEGIPAPLISVSPDSLSDSLLIGQTATHALAISNLGGNDLVWSLAPSVIVTAGGEDLAQRMAENADSPPPSGTVPSGNVDAGGPPSATLAGMYTGAHLRFGISDYGEIMPFQHPVGTDHLAVSTWLSGYTLAYRVAGSDFIARASYFSRSNIVPVSYTEIENGASRLVAEVVVRTSDNRLRIHRTFTFLKNDRYVRIETRLENTSGGSLSDVVYKEYADWDVDVNFDNNWDYDLSRNMAYAWRTRYCTIAAVQTPTVMDLYGWDDYARRATFVDFPTGPVSGVDGLEILHFDLGNMPNGAQRAITAAYASANDLAQLQAVVDRAVVRWLRVEPMSGTVPPGMGADVDVTFDAVGLAAGDYDAVIEITNNDPLSPLVEVPTHLHATGVPDIAVSADSLDFGPLLVGGSDTAVIEILNEGTDVLSVSDVSTDNGDYTVDVTASSVNPGESREVRVTFAPSTTGMSIGTLSITSNDPDEPVLEVSLAGEGMPAPLIAVSPNSLSDSLLTGETATHALTISNLGGDDLVWFLATSTILSSGGEDLVQRMAENAGSPPPSETVPPGNVDAGGPPPAILAGTYTGAHLSFGISDYGEIMPFQHPIGTEHLAISRRISGYTVAYRVAGLDNLAWASYEGRSNIVPVSYTELENGPSRLVVEVVVRTSDNRLRIHRIFTFPKNDRYVRVETRLENTSGGSLGAVLYKEYADWDVDSNFSNNWDYDFDRNMAYAWRTRYCTIAAVQAPTVMDLYGWDDYARRATLVDYPTGPVSGLDGLEILVFFLGGMPNGAQRSITAVFASADDLVQLQAAVDRAVVRWLRVEPASGTVPPGMSADVDVTFDAAGLVAGDYNAVIEIGSNDPATPTVAVPALLTVDSALVVTTGVDPNAGDKPTRYALQNNFPNPFNPSTTIRYDVAEATDVRLEIYNIKGERVAVLVDKHQPAGRYGVRWNGHNSSGQPVASGVYFYKLRAGQFVQTRKMQLLK